MSFDTLGLTPELLRAVEAEGYTEPTPVQAEAIPHVLARRDVLAGAQTGTGKTAAFVLPILQLLHAEPAHAAASHPRERQRRPALVRRQAEIASGLPDPLPRAHADARARDPGRGVRQELQPLAARPLDDDLRRRRLRRQFKAIHAGPEIVVATPGPPARHPGAGQDRPSIGRDPRPRRSGPHARHGLHQGHPQDHRPAAAQAAEPHVLGDLRRRRPRARGDDPPGSGAGPDRAPATRRSSSFARSSTRSIATRKRELLSHLIRSGRIDRALVFTRTKHGANRLAEQLEYDGIARNRDPRQQDPGPAHPRPRRLQGRQGRDPRRHRGRRPRPRHRRPAPRRELRAPDRRLPTTSIASGEPAEPAWRATRSRSSASTRPTCSQTSRRCSASPFRGSTSPASSPIAGIRAEPIRENSSRWWPWRADALVVGRQRCRPSRGAATPESRPRSTCRRGPTERPEPPLGRRPGSSCRCSTASPRRSTERRFGWRSRTGTTPVHDAPR